jgi:hypothetical protein
MKTNVYIDGFNFYYAVYAQREWEDAWCHERVGNGPYKWADFAS